MARRVTLAFAVGESLAIRTGALVDAGPHTVTVRLDEVGPDGSAAADERTVLGHPDRPVVAVVHAPLGDTGTVFLLSAPLPGRDDPAVIRLARTGHAP